MIVNHDTVSNIMGGAGYWESRAIKAERSLAERDAQIESDGRKLARLQARSDEYRAQARFIKTFGSDYFDGMSNARLETANDLDAILEGGDDE